jgi:hypothetical protein
VTEQEEQFKGICEDSVRLIKALKPYCDTFDELIGLLESGAGDGVTGGNAAALRLLMKQTLAPAAEVKPKQNERRP